MPQREGRYKWKTCKKTTVHTKYICQYILIAKYQTSMQKTNIVFSYRPFFPFYRSLLFFILTTLLLTHLHQNHYPTSLYTFKHKYVYKTFYSSFSHTIYSQSILLPCTPFILTLSVLACIPVAPYHPVWTIGGRLPS